MSRFRLLPVFALLVAALCSSLQAATFIVPSDGQLFDVSRVVAIVQVRSFQPRFNDDGEIVTEITLEVEDLIKGDAPAEIRILEMGGTIGDQRRIVSGVPDYFPNERALVFLTREGTIWRTQSMMLGKFSFVDGANGPLLARGASEEEVFGWDMLGRRHKERLRKAPQFLAYLRGRAAGVDLPQDYFLDEPPPIGEPILPIGTGGNGSAGTVSGSMIVDDAVAVTADSEYESVTASAHYPASVYTMGTSRWKIFDDGGSVSYRITGSQPGYDSVGVARAALAAWTDEPNSNVRLQLASGAGGGFVKDGVNSIVYNNSTDVPSGAIGYAQIYSVNKHDYKGESFWTVVEGDVVMKSGLNVSATVFLEAVTHEVGHTIALRHSDQGTPSTSDAIMNSVVTGKWGATLSPYDKEAVSHVYGSASGGSTPPTFVFTDDPLVAGVTVIKAVHLAELRNAVNSVRAYAGLPPASWTDAASPGVIVKAIHWTELRDRLNEARSALGRAPVAFATPVQPGAVIRAEHVQTLRNGVRL